MNPEVTEIVLRKKELIDRVVARSGIKKKDAKPTIEAMLAVLGEAMAAGEELNLQPMGKVMIKRVMEKPNAKVLVCRIRQRKESASSVVTIVPKS
ncbi:MAG TPA: DNA-binding protein [Rhodobacteraceae bacterium]|nr:DNA-binding protein [Paracoccaceae bacterium]